MKLFRAKSLILLDLLYVHFYSITVDQSLNYTCIKIRCRIFTLKLSGVKYELLYTAIYSWLHNKYVPYINNKVA